MNSIFICNTSSDCVSRVDIDSFREECKIKLSSDRANKVGPHGICLNNQELLVANNYSNSLTILDIDRNIKMKDYYIGVHCNDVTVFNSNAYIICGELNNVVIFNLMKNKVIEQLPCGNLPHSIDLNREKKLILIANMQSDSVTLIDCDEIENVKEIKVGPYPTKALFTVDGQYILVCESNIGSYYRGSIAVVAVKTLKLINRITVGKSPVDMFCDERLCYVSNFGEGTVSVIDINNSREIKKINTGGMPRGILKFDRCIYVGDNYNNILMKIDITNDVRRTIPIGGEPTGMILLNR